jgi:hypothetical protein
MQIAFLPESECPLLKHFLRLQTLRFEVFIEDWGYSNDSKSQRTLVFTPSHPPGEFVNCNNPECYNGGVSIQNILTYFMIPGRQTEYSERLRCQGYEGTPKGRKNRGPCDRSFDVKVTVTYRD